MLFITSSAVVLLQNAIGACAHDARPLSARKSWLVSRGYPRTLAGSLRHFVVKSRFREMLAVNHAQSLSVKESR